VFPACFVLFRSSLFLPLWFLFVCLTFNQPKLITFQAMIYQPVNTF
jgi:hypothetical protein